MNLYVVSAKAMRALERQGERANLQTGQGSCGARYPSTMQLTEHREDADRPPAGTVMMQNNAYELDHLRRLREEQKEVLKSLKSVSHVFCQVGDTFASLDSGIKVLTSFLGQIRPGPPGDLSSSGENRNVVNGENSETTNPHSEERSTSHLQPRIQSTVDEGTNDGVTVTADLTDVQERRVNIDGRRDAAVEVAEETRSRETEGGSAEAEAERSAQECSQLNQKNAPADVLPGSSPRSCGQNMGCTYEQSSDMSRAMKVSETADETSNFECAAVSNKGLTRTVNEAQKGHSKTTQSKTQRVTKGTLPWTRLQLVETFKSSQGVSGTCIQPGDRLRQKVPWAKKVPHPLPLSDDFGEFWGCPEKGCFLWFWSKDNTQAHINKHYKKLLTCGTCKSFQHYHPQAVQLHGDICPPVREKKDWKKKMGNPKRSDVAPELVQSVTGASYWHCGYPECRKRFRSWSAADTRHAI